MSISIFLAQQRLDKCLAQRNAAMAILEAREAAMRAEQEHQRNLIVQRARTVECQVPAYRVQVPNETVEQLMMRMSADVWPELTNNNDDNCIAPMVV